MKWIIVETLWWQRNQPLRTNHQQPAAPAAAASAAAAAVSCLLQLRASLTQGPEGPREVQVVTGFLGKGVQTGAITTLGRGGSDLTATVLGAAMELREVQVGAAVRIDIDIVQHCYVCDGCGGGICCKGWLRQCWVQQCSCIVVYVCCGCQVQQMSAAWCGEPKMAQI
jgi:hypothetical protein